jgi:hypothetical protein
MALVSQELQEIRSKSDPASEDFRPGFCKADGFPDSATPELLQLLNKSFALCDFWTKCRA